MDEIIRNPRNIKELANEIIKVCDGYWARQIPEGSAKEHVVYWSRHEGKKLFKAKEFNPTVVKIIGKKRVELLEKWLEGYQTTF